MFFRTMQPKHDTHGPAGAKDGRCADISETLLYDDTDDTHAPRWGFKTFGFPACYKHDGAKNWKQPSIIHMTKDGR